MRKRSNFGRSGTKKKREGAFNLPNDEELEKLKKDTEKFQKQLDEYGVPLKRMTQSQLMGLIRSAIREKWMYANNKLAYLHMGIEPDFDKNTRRRFKVQCEMCGEWFSKGDICIDHKVGEHSLKSLEDFESFVESILYVGYDDLQRLCSTCHDLKTAMERYNLTEDEAILFKKLTAWENKYPKADARKKELKKLGYTTDAVANHEKRRECYLNYLKQTLDR